jgi:GNAT superfamily N-acetyltransferase
MNFSEYLSEAKKSHREDGIYFRASRDSDDEGYYITAKTPHEKNYVGGDLDIAHLHVPDDYVRGGHFAAGDVWVNEKHRRKGIATDLYKHAAKYISKKEGSPHTPVPASTQSPDGEAMWKGFKSRNLFESNLTEALLTVDQVHAAYKKAYPHGHDKNGKPLPAPKQGELFKPTQADAKKQNFKDWFAGSKAVHTNGHPIRMYHTTRNDFHSFEVGRTTKNSGTFGNWETQRHAIFVTPDREASQTYGKQGGKFKDGANVMPVHVAAKNPLDLRDGKHMDIALGDKFREHGISTTWLNHFHWGHFDGEDGKAFVDAAKKMGHDAIIFHEHDPDTDKRFESWAIFHPHQIKSIYNRGTYNPATPNISEEASEPMTRKLTLSTVEQEKKQAQLVEETKDLPMFEAVQKFAEAGFELNESVFDQKLGSPHAMDRFYIATHGSDAHRDQLVKDEDAMVRFGVAKTGHMTHLAQLANDPSPMVRDQVARRGDEELAKKLATDPHPMVRSSAYNRMQEIRRTIDDPAIISSMNEGVEEAKHFNADDTIQVKADGRFAKVKTFFEAKDGTFWYLVGLPSGAGTEVLHESEVRDLNESFKVTHYEASAHHTSTGSTDTGVYPFLPEHGADETGLDIDKAKEVIDQLNAKGDKGSIRYRYSLRTEDALKALDAKKKIEERHSDTEWAIHREIAGTTHDDAPKHDMSKPIKLKRKDGSIHSTHDDEKSALAAYSSEKDNKGMKIVRESVVDPETLLEMGGGGGGHDAERDYYMRVNSKPKTLMGRVKDGMEKAGNWIDDNAHHVVAGALGVATAAAIGLAAYCIHDAHEAGKRHDETISTLTAKDPAAAKAYQEHFEGYVKHRPHNIMIGKQQYPVGDAAKSSYHYGKMREILSQHGVHNQDIEESLQEGFKNECPFCNPALMESVDQEILTEEHQAAQNYHTEQAKNKDLPLEERHFHSRCFMKHQRAVG